MVFSVGIRCAGTTMAPRARIAGLAIGFHLPPRCPSSPLLPRSSASAGLFHTSSPFWSLSAPSPARLPRWSCLGSVTVRTYAPRSLVLASRALSSSCVRRSQSVPRSTPPSGAPPPSPKPPLSEDILTLPNLLTMVRLGVTPYIGYLVATHQFVPACVLLFLASITDVLDGWLARKTGKYTVFGSIADPAADKALVTTMVISLAMSGMLPSSLAFIILGRDLALVTSAFVIRYQTLQHPKTWRRYFNPKLPSATVTPTTISKYNTFLQLLLLGLLTLYPILFPDQPSPTLAWSRNKQPVPVQSQAETAAVADARNSLAETGLLSPKAKQSIDSSLTALMWLVAFTTVWSGLGYIGGAGTRKVLAERASKMRSSLSTPKPKPKP